MKNSPDPSVHRMLQQQMMQHVQHLLDDDRLRVDTVQGRRPVTSLLREINRTDRAVELKRTMSEMDLPDRDLEARMPVGEMLDVLLGRRKWLVLRQPVGRLKVICISPTRALLSGEAPAPMTTADVQKVLAEVPPPLRGAPVTLVLMSTSGFAIATHEMAERRSDRTLILVEPNDAGGWSVYGPAETRALADLFDPEAEDKKRQRIVEYIQSHRGDLLSSGLATDAIAAKTQLPLQLIENQLREYARSNPGLTAKRLDGRVVLFPEGTMPPAAATAAAAGSSGGGGSDMPFIERLKSLFSRKGDTEKKIALLSERRATMGLQRDRAYEEMSALEQKESELRQQFKDARAPLTRRRITSQLLQLRKDLERRQQLLSVLNQQMNIVSTHLHNLELVQQGHGSQLPDSQELTSDAEAAEAVLAELQANTELASSVSQSSPTGGLSDEEQALFEELEREASSGTAAAPQPPVPQTPQAAPEAIKQPSAPSQVAPSQPTRSPSWPEAPERRSGGEAEPG